MRIKTSQNIVQIIDDLQVILNFSTKAEVLKLAIDLAIFNDNLEVNEIKEDGFEIDTNILFDKDKEYYYYLIKKLYKTGEIKKEYIVNLIENGIYILESETKRSKGNIDILLNNIILQTKER